MLYDLFICHASEDKASFVRPLAEALQAENVAVWYDEFTLKIGDSIRRAIERGLKQSRYGAVVLSPSFFKKEWTQYELDGLVEREMRGADKVILPVWHQVNHDQVLDYSPPLAGRKAANSSYGMQAVVTELLEVVSPQGSPLVAARDYLLEWGVTPPVITDAYWLNVTEASNRSPGFGAVIPDDSIWDMWSFPLPPKGDTAEEWGTRLAWSAMQLSWVKAAAERKINLISHPDLVLEFIYEQPGLLETCMEFPRLVSEYAPQLVIPGLGGELEQIFENQYIQSCEKRADSNDRREGSALTTTNKPPLCDDDWALRHPTFGNYEAPHVACEYFSGGIFGPSVSPYENADHLFWLLSSDSQWMPQNIRQFLTSGVREWAVWQWHDYQAINDRDWNSLGKLADRLFEATKQQKSFEWNEVAQDDLRNRIAVSVEELRLRDSVENIVEAFLKGEFAQGFVEENLQRRGREKTE